MITTVALLCLGGLSDVFPTRFVPDKPQTQLIRYRFGEKAVAVSAMANDTFGRDPSGRTFTQIFGGVNADFGIDIFQTSFFSVVGFEGEASVGAGQYQHWSDGQILDWEGKAASGDLVLQAGLNARFKAAPIVYSTPSFGLRLSLMMGFDFEMSTARFEGGPFLATFGSQLLLAFEDVSFVGAWIWAPPQLDARHTLTWHTFSLHIPIGPVMIGGKVRLDRFSAASDLKQTNAVTALMPTAFVGYAF